MTETWKGNGTVIVYPDFILNICEGFLPREYKPSDKVSNIDEKCLHSTKCNIFKAAATTSTTKFSMVPFTEYFKKLVIIMNHESTL